MIDVNLTLFVQAFNFLIVCLILKHLFFKPAITELQKEEKAKANLESGIDHQQSLLQEKINKKEETWQKYQSHFLKIAPSVKPRPLPLFKEEIEPKEIAVTPGEVEQLTKHIQRALVERMQHVRE